MTHHKLWTAVDMAGADPAVRAPCSAVTMARSQLPVVSPSTAVVPRSDHLHHRCRRSCISACLGWSLAQPCSPSLPMVQVRSEDSKASCGELPHSPYRSIFGGLWQHGEPHNIVFSDEHGSVTNEVGKGLGCR